jgi:hypothetical protein
MAAPEGVTRVAIADGWQGAGSHRLKPQELSLLGRVVERMKTIRPRHALKQARHLVTSLTRTKSRRQLEFMMLCPNISDADMAKRFPVATLFRSWEELRAALEERHGKGSVKVAVYPCAPLQFQQMVGGSR